MDASINFMGALLDNLPENNVPWICMQVFFIASKLPIFTYLGVDNTAPLGIISVKYSFILVESHLL
jgi:hypothetical protein